MVVLWLGLELGSGLGEIRITDGVRDGVRVRVKVGVRIGAGVGAEASMKTRLVFCLVLGLE